MSRLGSLVRVSARWPLCLAAALWFALSAAAAETALADRDVDPQKLAQVRAAFLLNFIRYTEYPAAAFESKESPYFVVVLGDAAVAEALELLAERAGPTSGRELRVIKLRAPSNETERASLANLLPRCHLAYLGEKPEPELLQALALASVLTVASDAEFVHAGGMIALGVEGKRVVFDVNPDVIRARGLVLSSRVLQLARSVSRNR